MIVGIIRKIIMNGFITLLSVEIIGIDYKE